MARRTSPPFRADHVGSLLRPQRLLQARDDFAAGRITAADLRSVEDQEIPKAVRMQEEVGLQSATDGEFRRSSWHMDFIYALGGVSKAPGHMAVKFRNAAGEIKFTPAEYNLLTFFLQNPDRPLSRDMILNSVWGYESFPNTRTVDAHVVRIRQKLEADPNCPRHFITLHKVGYRFLP